MSVVVLPSVKITQGLEANLNWRMRDRAANAFVDLSNWSGVFSLYDAGKTQIFTAPLGLYADGMITISIPAETTADFAGGAALGGREVFAFQIDLASPEPSLSQKWQGVAQMEKDLAE